MENQFKMRIVAHIERLEIFYKVESEIAKKEMDNNPKLKQPREEYLKKYSEYRAYNSLLANIYAGNYDSVDYYNQYLKPKK